MVIISCSQVMLSSVSEQFICLLRAGSPGWITDEQRFSAPLWCSAFMWPSQSHLFILSFQGAITSLLNNSMLKVPASIL